MPTLRRSLMTRKFIGIDICKEWLDVAVRKGPSREPAAPDAAHRETAHYRQAELPSTCRELSTSHAPKRPKDRHACPLPRARIPRRDRAGAVTFRRTKVRPSRHFQSIVTCVYTSPPTKMGPDKFQFPDVTIASSTSTRQTDSAHSSRVLGSNAFRRCARRTARNFATHTRSFTPVAGDPPSCVVVS